MKNKLFTIHFPRSFIYLSVLFLVISIIQSVFTELANDEAYYWRFAQELDWGYFDHPPFTAIMIAASSFFIKGELGVRLFSVLFGFASIYILWILIDDELKRKKNAVLIFFLLWFSLPIFNIYTFITVPDSPLLFFSLLYILILRRLKQKPNLMYGLALGLIMSLLLYSKYHGVLLILITLIADLKLLKNKYFYLASFFGFLLFLPHLLWQYQHDFPSIKYHFIERNSEFSFKHIAEYPMNVLIVLNPLLFLVFIVKDLRNKSKEKKEKTLRYVFWGFIIFFAFSSFKSHVEPHWVAVSSIPLLILLFKYAVYSEKIKRLVKIFAWISISILLIGRILLIFDIVNYKTEFHGNKELAGSVEEVAGDLPVLFLNSYTKASKYSFYTGKPAFSYNSIQFRKNQYDIWNYEDTLLNKPFCFVTNYNSGKRYTKLDEKYFYKIFSHYQPVKKVELITDNKFESIKSGEEYMFDLVIFNPYSFNINTEHDEFPVLLKYSLGKGNRIIHIGDIDAEMPEKIMSKDSLYLKAAVLIPEEYQGEYLFRLSLSPGILNQGFNSKTFKTVLKK